MAEVKNGEEPKGAIIQEATDAIAALNGFTPEAMFVDATGKKLQLLSDDGDTCSNADPKFRGVVLTLD